MKIAVTYDKDNGTVFQHFGHSEAFKVYQVEDGEVGAGEVMGTDGAGHEALAGVLKNHDIDVLLCGGMGSGAQVALAEAGIEVCSGVTGDADQAVVDYLAGKLESAGVNCDHHDHEHGHDEEGGCGHCGGGCGSSCGGCGSQELQILFPGKNAGKKVKTHYDGTLNDGTKFDSSYDRGEPLEFVCGVGMMIPGFDKAVVEMNPGDVVNVHLTPEEAYGERTEQAIFTVEQSQMPGCEQFNTGDKVFLQNAFGQPFPAVIAAKDETTITFDANHELAGQELNFKIKLVEVAE